MSKLKVIFGPPGNFKTTVCFNHTYNLISKLIDEYEKKIVSDKQKGEN